MAIPTRTLAATIEISTGAMTITSQPPEFVGEVSATAVEISLLMGGEAYTPSGVSALMYLYWPGTPKMTEAVALTIDGSVLRGNLTDAMTVRPGCPLLVIQLVDGGTGDVIVAAASPIQITQVRGSMVVSTRPADPEEIVYVGRAPYINPSTLTWMQWDATSRSYVDSGVYAVGQGVASVNGILPTTPGGNVQVRGTDIAVSSTDTRTIAEALEDAGPVQTVNGVSPDLSGNVAVTAADIGQTAITTDNDTVDEALETLSEEIVNLQDGLAIIVDGDVASVAVPVGGYAYIKNNTHGLMEGLYKNTSSSVFPATGGTANSTVFSEASGVLNTVDSEIATLNSNLAPSFSNPGFNKVHGNITNVERAIVKKCGKIVVVDLTFTVDATISDATVVLFNGLPKSYGTNQRFRIPNTSDGSMPDLVLAITRSGEIVNQYTSGGIRAGQWEGQFTYVTSE